MVLEKVIEIIAEHFMLDADEITADTDFEEELKVDSLDKAELTVMLEEEFSLPETPEEELRKFRTVGDLANYISRATQK